MKRFIAYFLVLSAPVVWADSPVAPALVKSPSRANLPKLSSFDREKIARDPFEPLVKTGGSLDRSVTVTAVKDAPDLLSLFRVTAVSIDRISIAVINRKAFAEKEFFKIRNNGKTINVRVIKVTDGEVELDCDGTRVTVNVVKPKIKLMED